MIKPVFSEKSLKLAKNGSYTFLVPKAFGKYKIKEIIEELFPVKVVKVSTVTKKKVERKNARGRTVTLPAQKKAVVSLKAGQQIELFHENTKKEKPKKAKKNKEK